MQNTIKGVFQKTFQRKIWAALKFSFCIIKLHVQDYVMQVQALSQTRKRFSLPHST